MDRPLKLLDLARVLTISAESWLVVLYATSSPWLNTKALAFTLRFEWTFLTGAGLKALTLAL